MPDVQQGREHLAQVEKHIADGERRVAEQRALIERMRTEGHDTSLAQEFLRNLEQSLEQWYAHRQHILQTIARG